MKCSLCARHCAECTGNVTRMMTRPLPSRADTPLWTQHTQTSFSHSADIDGHEDHVSNTGLFTGDAPVTILPNSLNHNKT